MPACGNAKSQECAVDAGMRSFSTVNGAMTWLQQSGLAVLQEIGQLFHMLDLMPASSANGLFLLSGATSLYSLLS